MTLTTVPCGLCGGTNFQLVYRQTIPIGEDSDPVLYYSSSRSKAGHFPIVRCTRCNLVMTNPRDDENTLEQVYANLQDRVYDSEDKSRRRTAQEHLTLVTVYHPSTACLLDVGCATGGFVCQAHHAGWQATGLDASQWAITRARERCPQARFVAGFLESVVFPAESFAVITMWDILEHVCNPSRTLESVRAWLTPNGWLFLNLPDFESIIARIMGRRWVLLLREHLWYFSPATITALLDKSGYELIQIQPNFVWFSVANVFSRLGQYPGFVGRVVNWLSRVPGLKSRFMKFPMGEMNVVARKKL